MSGNRDFLIGEKFLNSTQITSLPEPTVITLGNKKALIMHGDSLCIDDFDYQNFRGLVRSNEWIENFLKKPIQERLKICQELRAQSENEKKNKTELVMDVNNEAVEDILRKNNYPAYLIHGHTHRPNTHDYYIENHYSQRWVLGDWHKNGNYILWKNNQLEFISIN